MLEPKYDPWLIGEVSKLLQGINVPYLRSRCVTRQVPGGRRTRQVFRPSQSDIRAFSQPWRQRVQVTWPSAVYGDTDRVGLFLESGDFSFDASGSVQVNISLDAALDRKFGPLNWAHCESNAMRNSGRSPIQALQELVRQRWPLQIDDPNRLNGICRGIANDLLSGGDVAAMLQNQRRQNERRAQ